MEVGEIPVQAASPLLSFPLPPTHYFLVQAAAAWALGQIGRHTPEHAKAVAQANVLPRLLQLYLNPESSEDLQAKVGGRIWDMYAQLVFQYNHGFGI